MYNGDRLETWVVCDVGCWSVKTKVKLISFKLELSLAIRFHHDRCISGDKLRVSEAGVPQGFVIQCIVNTLDFDVITSKE